MAADERPDQGGVGIERTGERYRDAGRRGSGLHLLCEEPVGAASEQECRHDHNRPCAEPSPPSNHLPHTRRRQLDERVDSPNRCAS
jgi:hypothetical protein